MRNLPKHLLKYGPNGGRQVLNRFAELRERRDELGTDEYHEYQILLNWLGWIVGDALRAADAEQARLDDGPMVEICCDGVVHYRRPANHPDVEEARDIIAKDIELYGESLYEVREVVA